MKEVDNKMRCSLLSPAVEVIADIFSEIVKLELMASGLPDSIRIRFSFYNDSIVQTPH